MNLSNTTLSANAPAKTTKVASGNLTVNESDKAKKTVETDRYRIEVTKHEVKVFDKESNTWVRAWGDPHVETSDGDKAQFHRDNLTIELKDGTKVTIKPTAVDANGIATIDGVLVLNGPRSAVVSNISGTAALKVEESSSGARARNLDIDWADGTVLIAGDQVDDLFNNDAEIKGTDPNARFNEHVLDGRGGTANNAYTNIDLNDPLYRRVDELTDKVAKAKTALEAEKVRQRALPADQRDSSQTDKLTRDLQAAEDDLTEAKAEMDARTREEAASRTKARETRVKDSESKAAADFDARVASADPYECMNCTEDEIERLSRKLSDPNLPAGVQAELLERKNKLQNSLDLSRQMMIADLEREKKKVDAFLQALQRLA